MKNNHMNSVLSIFNQKGLRVTPQRLAIYHYLKQSYSHPTVEMIYNDLKEKLPNISVTTIYNNLKVFKYAGLVKELTFGDNSSRFETDTSEHCHVICQKCDEISDLDHPLLEEFREYAVNNSNYNIYFQSFIFYGLCENCKNEKLLQN